MTGRAGAGAGAGAGAAESRSGPELRTVMLRQEWNVSLNQQESGGEFRRWSGRGG